MSTTVLLGLTSFEKNWGPVDFWGASDFSNLLAPWASGSRSLMLRAGVGGDPISRKKSLLTLEWPLTVCNLFPNYFSRLPFLIMGEYR